MNTNLQTKMKLLAADYALSFSLGAMASDAPVAETPAMPMHWEHRAMHEEMQQMTPEQRAERRCKMREKMRKLRKAMPPEGGMNSG